MKRLLVPAALALALAVSVAVAQNPATPPPGGQKHFRHHHNNGFHRDPQRQAQHIGKKLNLTPDQTAKLAPIFADRNQKMQALWQNQQLASQDKHQQMRALEKSTHEQLTTVLTPDQLQQLKSKHHERGEHTRHGHPGAQPLTPQAPPAA